MKRYLLKIATIVLMLTTVGCQKQLGDDTPQAKPTAEVNVMIDDMNITSGETRATVVSDILNLDAGFTMVGFHTTKSDKSANGTFAENIGTLTPNIFNYKGDDTYDTNSVIPVQKNEAGKFTIQLSRWGLDENSHLSYIAWAANVIALSPKNPIKAATADKSLGAPFLDIECANALNELHNTDIIAAKTLDNRNDVVRNKVELNFKHLLSKVKFTVRNKTAVSVTVKTTKIKFAQDKVARAAKFLFNDKSLTIGEWQTPTAFLTSDRTLTNNEAIASNTNPITLDEILLIPQSIEAGAISVELTCIINNTEFTRTIGLKAQTLVQNTSYTYDLVINEDKITVNEGVVGSWIIAEENGMPNIAGKCDAETLLLLDGYDAPYTHTDGKKYWLDRSGWNRHCEIIGTTISYNATEKCYSFNKSGYIDVPPFSKTTNASIETIARRTNFADGGSQNLMNFATTEPGFFARIMFTHFGYNGGTNYYFDAGGVLNVKESYGRITSTMPEHIYTSFAMYTFSKQLSRQVMFRNLLYNYDTFDAGHGVAAGVDLSIATKRQIGNEFSGDIKYFKVLSTAKNNVDPIEYAALAKRHNVPNTEYVSGYVQNGLVLDLQGANPPQNNVWKDASGQGADARFVGTNVIYDPEKKEYQTNIDQKSYLDVNLTAALKALDGLKNHTLEIVYYVPKINGSFVPNRHEHFNAKNDKDNRLVFFHIGYSTDYRINYQSPYFDPTDSRNRITSFAPTAGTGADMVAVKRRYVAIRDTDGALKIMADNKLLHSLIGTYTSISTITKIHIGQDAMNISAVRLYNRTLTEAELTQNYLVDKKAYNIP